MSLRSKIVLVLSLLVVSYALFDNLIQRFVVRETFVALEQEEAQRNLQRAVASIDRETEDLEADCRRWATWDATKRFVQDRTFVTSDPDPAVLSENDLHLLYLVEPEGRVAWGRIEEPGTRERLQLREFPGGALMPTHPLLPPPGAPSPRSGLLATEHGLMFVASHPIRADGTGDSGEAWRTGGTVVMGRFLDDDLAGVLGERVQVSFTIWPVEGELPARERELLDEITGATEPVLSTEGEGLSVYTTLSDVRLAPSLLLRVDVPREITAQGDRVLLFAQVSTVATSLLILTVLLLLLQRIVIRPLTKLTSSAVEVGRTDDTSIRTGMRSEDEIGLLSKEFDRMLDKLAEARAQNIRTARTAGMSEIATGVLHNIGNVLNSVNVSANLATRKSKELALTDLEKLVGVLKKNEESLAEFVTSDPRGKHLLPFLSELTGALGTQRAELSKELESLRSGVEHIAELVRSQQSYAVKTGAFEKAKVEGLMEKAMAMSEKASRPFDIEVVREYEELPQVAVDSQKVIEILVNLIQNARHALEDSSSDKRVLHLRTRSTEEGTVRFEVEDNGTGISAENLTRIFNHGFTTKKKGHGFGLHVSANFATEMGGSLRALSAGPGKGSTFVLEFPLKTGSLATAE